jgi:hypothetical protein
MSHAVSIHIGVNDPQARSAFDNREQLIDSETAAWRMAELASQAGYDSMLVLRGQAATLAAAHASLWSASQLLTKGDTLLVTFSGHGGQVPDRNGDDPLGSDESWSLYDGELLDDQLCGYWRLFKAGVRIVVVSESCYSGGMMRSVDESKLRPVARPEEGLRRGEPYWVDTDITKSLRPAADEPSPDACGVRATVLMLTASGETQVARGGLFTDCLLKEWAGGNFSGSYRALYEAVKKRVMNIKSDQEPQILMMGAPAPEFPQAPAFRPQRGPARPRSASSQVSTSRNGSKRTPTAS